MHTNCNQSAPDRAHQPSGCRRRTATADPRAPLSRSALLSLQRGAGNRAAATIVQRYSLVNPNHYRLAAGSAFESQDMVAGGNAVKFVTERRERAGGGGTVDTRKESAPGQGGATWNTTANRVQNNAALPRIKYATNGTDAIAVEHTAKEPKVFFATPSLIGPSNAALLAAGADAHLVDVGGPLKAPKDPASPAGPRLTLHTIKPASRPTGGQAPQVLEKFGGMSECNAFIKMVIGEISERVAVFGSGQGHEALVAEEKEPTHAIATFAATGAGDGAALAAHLTTTGTHHGDHDNPLPGAYQNLVNKPARDATLGINAGAKAGVGEGYVITQGSPMPGNVTLRAWLDGLDAKLAGAALSPAEVDMFKHKWGYHYAGIVARVGDDAISLENYNRATQQAWAMDDLCNQRVAAVAGLRNKLEQLANAGQTVPSIPAQRNIWFAKLLAELDALGAAATADEIASRTALRQVATAITALQVNPVTLWHFKMYGTGAGQSFHEQWAGAVDDPMTLRIRQSVELSKGRYEARLDAAARQLESEKPSTNAGQLLGGVAMRVTGLRAAGGALAVGAAFNEARTLIERAAITAMHDWAVDAAQEMGEKTTVVPAAPAGAGHLDKYAPVLDALIAPWEKKGGWAVRKKSKQRLVARQQRIADLRRKIGVAASVSV